MSIEVTSLEQFNALLNKGPVMAKFYTTWCGPCKMYKSTFEKLAETHPKITFVSVDVEKVREVGAKYSIRTVPQFIGFAPGVEPQQWTGVNKARMEKVLDSLV